MYTCVLGAIIKDEHDYLAEWIEYHLSIGIEHIYLYEDKGSKPHGSIVKQYEGKVSLISLDNEKYEFLHNWSYLKQTTLYNLILLEQHDKYDYIGFLDIDEFLTFEDGFTLQDLLSENKENRAFIIQWKVIGANNLIEQPNNVLDAYDEDVSSKYEFGHLPYKSFINLHKIVPLECTHNPIIVDNTYSYLNKDKVYISHFYTKSWDDWCNRFLIRGDLVPDNRQITDFFRLNPDMLPMKEELLERFFSKCSIEKDDVNFIHVFSHTPITKRYYHHMTFEDMLSYDILCYSLSFTFLKKMGKKVKLYATTNGAKYLNHLKYDEVVIIPDDFDCDSGLRCLPTIYAFKNEPLSSVFVHGDCFLKEPIILNFLEYIKKDVMVLQEHHISSEEAWKFFVSPSDITPLHLSPNLLHGKNSFDLGILKFNNQKLKDDFIEEVLKNISLYKESLAYQFWDISRSFLPDRGIFSFILRELVDQGKYTYEEMGGVKLNYYKYERNKEKLKFMGILHLTQSSKFNETVLSKVCNLFIKTDKEAYNKANMQIEKILKER